MGFLRLTGHWPWQLSKLLSCFSPATWELVSDLMRLHTVYLLLSSFWITDTIRPFPALKLLVASLFLQLTFQALCNNTDPSPCTFPIYLLNFLFLCMCFPFSHVVLLSKDRRYFHVSMPLLMPLSEMPFSNILGAIKILFLFLGPAWLFLYLYLEPFLVFPVSNDHFLCWITVFFLWHLFYRTVIIILLYLQSPQNYRFSGGKDLSYSSSYSLMWPAQCLPHSDQIKKWLREMQSFPLRTRL